MHHFAYRAGVLHAEGVALDALAAAHGTPLYVYSTATIERHYRLFAGALAPGAVHYAVKANANLGVLMTLARLGAGADVVSEGEARKALLAGVPAERIVFSGVGKSDAELAFAVDAGLHQVNVETEDELRALSVVAAAKFAGTGRRQPIALRVNPKVGAGGHAKITTGGEGDKFGVSFEEAARLYAEAATMPGVLPLGLAVHIGSQITELSALEAAFVRMRGLVEALRARGLAVERLDFGGGLGIPYDQDDAGDAPSPLAGPGLIKAYAAMVRRVTAGLDVALAYEPGRLIVGNAGVLLARVLRLNPRGDGTGVVVLDAAMNDLLRPAMYDAHHAIWPVREPAAGAPRVPVSVVGPVCESGDTFARARPLPALAPGDLVAIMSAGAYGASMASTYNLRPLVAEAMVRGSEAALTRPRQTYEDLVGRDVAPGWLG